jgi:hypothetical protein
MKVENSITAKRFRDLDAGDAFAFELGGENHICIKIFNNPHDESEFSCLSLTPGYPQFNAPGIFCESFVNKSKVSELPSLVFRTSMNPLDIILSPDTSISCGLVAIQKNNVFIYAYIDDILRPVNINTGKMLDVLHEGPIVFVKKWVSGQPNGTAGNHYLQLSPRKRQVVEAPTQAPTSSPTARNHHDAGRSCS